MALDAIQLLSNLRHWPDCVVQMALLMLLVILGVGREVVVVFECENIVIGIRVEQCAEDFGVGSCALAPLIPEFGGKRVRDEVCFWSRVEGR